jgi:crotonobetainyl-CoA:carnitine CoA-transferase CaiB-like acyl-CoA transferase
MNLNRNKRSVYLDLSKAEDLANLQGLLTTATVFVSNVRMKSLTKLGLDYDSVAKIKPDIIYAHAVGYDSAGPDKNQPAYDDLIQARSGMTDLLSRVSRDNTPRYLPSLVADKVSGLFLAQAILAALYHHKATGQGQRIEVPMLETMTTFNLVEHFFNQTFDPPQGDWCYPRVVAPNRKPFPTKDGFVAIVPYSTEEWERIFQFFGKPGAIADNPKYSTLQERTRHIDELYAELAEVSPTRTTADWIKLLREMDIPHAKMNRLEDLQSDEQLQSVGMFQRQEHPGAGGYFALRPPVKFSATPSSIHRQPPGLGEHTDEVLREIDRSRQPLPDDVPQ